MENKYLEEYPFNENLRDFIVEKKIDNQFCVLKTVINICGYVAIDIQKLSDKKLKRLICFNTFEFGSILSLHPRISYCKLTKFNEFLIVGFENSGCPADQRRYNTVEIVLKVIKDLYKQIMETDF